MRVQYLYDENIKTIYDVLINICRSISNDITVDVDNYRIIMKTDMSAFSYGEIIEIFVSKKGKATIVTIEGRKKMFFNVTANERKYIDQIIYNLNNNYSGQQV